MLMSGTLPIGKLIMPGIKPDLSVEGRSFKPNCSGSGAASNVVVEIAFAFL
jgi:hypothetical protein